MKIFKLIFCSILSEAPIAAEKGRASHLKLN